ncbi:proteasome assembly chaperone 2 [Sitophilus oryzae]|uniref:Proteasome assembly chaperone 2 n=1 Tax=Sitophilus oryzae TaxID=7048 RepID=A0A6J2YIL9_SITOR|nr:proteasome assembly chaperone 2 [Sitophilus oryzae]
MSLINFETPIDLTGFTIIVPSITVGNVPQLTVDLLITTLKLKKAGILWHSALVSSVGSDPFNSKITTPSTAAELYYNSNIKVAVIQFRSTFNVQRLGSFITDLSNSFTALKIDRVILLASLFDYELSNVQDKESIFYSSSTEINEELIENLRAKPLQQDEDGEVCTRGTGFAAKFYNILRTKVNCMLVVKYVSEGDNTLDAKKLLSQLFDIVNIKSGDYTVLIPESWTQLNDTPVLGIF